MIQTHLVIALIYVVINWLLTRLASWRGSLTATVHPSRPLGGDA